MTRWIKGILKTLLGLILLLAAGLGLWVFHTQPMYDGQLRSEGLKEPVNIKRDGADVVHIFAQSDRDAAFALGFAHAQSPKQTQHRDHSAQRCAPHQLHHA